MAYPRHGWKLQALRLGQTSPNKRMCFFAGTLGHASMPAQTIEHAWNNSGMVSMVQRCNFCRQQVRSEIFTDSWMARSLGIRIGCACYGAGAFALLCWLRCIAFSLAGRT